MHRFLPSGLRESALKHPLPFQSEYTASLQKRVLFQKVLPLAGVVDNSALVLVLPYLTAEYENNHQSFHEYYDEIEICQDAAEGHYKAAIQVRNQEMVDRSDLIVCCIEHNSGGAFQTVEYAKKKNKEIVNLSDQ